MKLTSTSFNEIASKFLRKVDSAIDRPKSYLELQNSGLISNRNVPYTERRVLRELVPFLDGNIQVAYDIGSHRGEYIHALSRLPGIRALVGFEPIPYCFGIAREKTKHDPRISIFNCALGSENGTIAFNLNDSDASSSVLSMRQEHMDLFPHTMNSRQIDIQLRRLDDLASEEGIPAPDLIKIDVQGYEASVIEGGELAFSRARYLLIELSFVPLYEGAPIAHEMISSLSADGWRMVSWSEPLIDKAMRWISANALFERVSDTSTFLVGHDRG